MTFKIPLEQIDDNPWQTRQAYTDLEDLAADIHRHGLLQPPVVRLVQNEHGHIRYQLAFGHRRFRAYALLSEKYGAAYDEFPTELHDLTDEQMADFAWSENEKRRDVTPIERMHAIRKQMEAFGWTQAQIAERRELSEATVSNILRLGQLPEEIQKKVHEGELSERAALPLITYFSLPETVRSAASKKSWIPDPVKNAHDGASSDVVREAVKTVVSQTALALDAQWLEKAFEGESFLAPTCLACANHFEHNKNHYCGEQTRNCFNAKKNAGRVALLQEAVELTGIPILEDGADYRAFYGFIGYGDARLASLHPTEDHPGILAQGCEHLRLRLDSTALPKESLADPKFHKNVGVVCCHPSRECTCTKAMHLARRQNEPADPQAEAREQEHQAERARLDRNAETFRTTFLSPTIQAILTYAQENDVRFWQFLAFKLTSQGWEEVRNWSLEQCHTELAEYLAWTRISLYETQTRPEDALETLNVTRTRLGLEPLTIPEDPQATPTEKLERRLQRIEHWLERWTDGELVPTFEAVEGNLTNLEKIKSEYAALPVDAQTLPAFDERLEAHLNGLSQWLDAYEAESDDDEADESLLEAYVGEAMPA